ncbi:unnamed protein product [Notodromas monacha]|uniref:Uncharacterized protein n=1 Tax=Notodromas monacha TaxID=399045 RepID=A0A7R9BS33_9CRUS|nr:unnamed protein product [Notodromas monacha]CAG0919757.1 unnamed protein product [Notodromas monacha]
MAWVIARRRFVVRRMLWYGRCEADVEDVSSVRTEGDRGGVEDRLRNGGRPGRRVVPRRGLDVDGMLRASEDGISPIGGVWCDTPEVRVMELEDNGPWRGMVLDVSQINHEKDEVLAADVRDEVKFLPRISSWLQEEGSVVDILPIYMEEKRQSFVWRVVTASDTGIRVGIKPVDLRHAGISLVMCLMRYPGFVGVGGKKEARKTGSIATANKQIGE